MNTQKFLTINDTIYTIKKYNSEYFGQWNNFIATSKNATFLFHRNFMEYHSNRFKDFSLLIFKKNQLVALLPANIENDKVYSHQGLTYGGLLLKNSIGIAKVEAIFKAILFFFKEHKITKFYLKSLPIFYHTKPSFDLEPYLFKQGAKIYKREQNFAIDFSLPLEIHKTKLKHYKKNKETGFKIICNNDFGSFWGKVLQPRLKSKHNAKPVHKVEEINLLHDRFPENIIQYNIYLNEEILAGITIFKDEKVVKSQYGATTENGEKFRALDYLFIYLIEKYKKENFHYFDMGIVAGNYSLLKQKEELGCRQYLQDFYSLQI